ncbi:LysM peptidoglycan-binding domain-containing protein [Uliginosibacterium paludis]|uniref:LysM peptidoglycan-binding domain-containing protein n=1 Tax=Uliginosibacterium paludis TaxID=1615952 RepID=A0ABV2CPY6_9RHOO
MPKFIKATYHPELKTAEFISDDGRHLLRTGGSLCWRLNNGGNLVSPVVKGVPCPRKTKGYIGFAKAGASEHHFFIFPDYETGRAELKATLDRKYADHTVSETIRAYAPKHDKNDTDQYITNLCKLSGVSKDSKLRDMSPEQLESIMDGIERIEGYHADAASRKEVWVNVTKIQASDGTRPIQGEEIVVKSDGKEVTLKSNAVGLFPPIVHGKSPVEIKHKTADGKLKSLGTLPADRSQHMSLVAKLEKFLGRTAANQVSTPSSSRKHSLTYTVQPGDSLSKIASKFQTTVAQLKHDNSLARDLIIPGQVLGIHAPPPSTIPPTPPKKAAHKSPASQPSAERTGQQSPPQAKPPKALQGQKTTPARSKAGSGEPIQLIQPEDGQVPWMKYAIAEAKRHKGAAETVIEKDIDYHSQINDGIKGLSGSLNAWCAAFANWCLMQAGYPIQNPKELGFVDRVAATGRAEGFRNLRGVRTKAKQDYKDVPFVDNPLYEKIDEPVYGAIGIVVTPSGHGQHVGFVYGRESEDSICMLGGNQGQTIKFSPFTEKEKEISLGKKKKKTNHLEFYIPNHYTKTHKSSNKKLEPVSSLDLNKEIGVKGKDNKNESTR